MMFFLAILFWVFIGGPLLTAVISGLIQATKETFKKPAIKS